MSIEFTARLKEGRSLYVLIPLLLLHLTLLSIQIEDPAGTILFKKWILQAGGPLLNVVASTSRGALGIWTDYVWLRGAREENARLRERLRELTLREDAASQMKEENARLRRLLLLRETKPFETLGAGVVARAPVPGFLSSILTIDRGSEEGIRLFSPVLGADGVGGRTVLVTAHNSQVQLITNTDAALGVMVERTRSPGVLCGNGGPLLDLKYINNTEQVEVNDLVVTSGLDGIYPKGLPVGKVVKSHKGTSVFRVVLVEPACDLLRLEEVLVLLGPSPVISDARPASGVTEAGK